MWAFVENNWLGIITIVGVIIAIWQVLKTKKSADVAAYTSNETREHLKKNFIIIDLSMALTIIDEIKNLNRIGKWDIVLERYSKLRGLLVNIKTQSHDFDPDDKRHLQYAVQQAKIMEEDIEEKVLKKSKNFDILRYNKFLSEIADALNAIVGKEKLDLSRGV